MKIPEESIINRIYVIRGQKVMIDRDLAELYGVETKRLKESVRRNKNRFPVDFMFVMNKSELGSWRTQIATSREIKKGLRYYPFCFTEQGVTMLSCILNSDRAIEVNIRVIRVFNQMRSMLLTQKDLMIKLEQVEKEIIMQGSKMKKNEESIQIIFDALKKLLNPPNISRPRIGFRRTNERD